MFPRTTILTYSVSASLNGTLVEINIKNGESCPVELFLIDKFNAEIGYCNIALLKAGMGVTEELKALVEIGRAHIEKYENNLQKYSGSYVG